MDNEERIKALIDKYFSSELQDVIASLNNGNRELGEREQLQEILERLESAIGEEQKFGPVFLAITELFLRGLEFAEEQRELFKLRN